MLLRFHRVSEIFRIFLIAVANVAGGHDHGAPDGSAPGQHIDRREAAHTVAHEVDAFRVDAVCIRIRPQVCQHRFSVLNEVGEAVVAVAAPHTPVGELHRRHARSAERLRDIQILLHTGIAVEEHHRRCPRLRRVNPGHQNAAKDPAAVTVNSQAGILGRNGGCRRVFE